MTTDRKTEAVALVQQAAVASATQQQIMTFAEKKALARDIATSGMYGLTETQALVLGLKAEALNLPFITACDMFHLILKKASMSAQAMQALYESRGGKIRVEQRDSEACILAMENPDGKTDVFKWTKKDADEYIILEKDGETGSRDKKPLSQKYNWNTSKKRETMLYYRTVSEGVRRMMPGVFLGIYTPDEVEEIQESREVAATVMDVGGGQSEDFSGPVEKALDVEVMMADGQLAELVALAGTPGKALAAIRGMFGKQKTGKNTTAKEAQAVIDALKANTPAPAPETPPERKPEAPQGKVTRPDEIEIGLDGEMDFKEEF